MTTFAGSGWQGQDDGVGTAASFLYPRGLELSPDGTLLYVADSLNDAVRKITVPGAVVTTFAGQPTQRGTTEGTGLAARFYHPRDAAVAPDGNVYVLDSANRRIRKITPAGVTSTLAGGTWRASRPSPASAATASRISTSETPIRATSARRAAPASPT